MNIEAFRAYCMEKPFVTESFPFDETTLVFKVLGKMFALTDLEEDFHINLKCNPEKAIELREKYEAVTPGYHMNKKHWNTVFVDGSIPDVLIKQWIDDSYTLVCQSLPVFKRKTLEKR
ncbi:MAG: MmcQ/YjbR family DNA-binding protein [Chlorobi bacterium]|nr:MmcQ/YjbR family DNA-binding protein [Chlorobiota bacterium]